MYIESIVTLFIIFRIFRSIIEFLMMIIILIFTVCLLYVKVGDLELERLIAINENCKKTQKKFSLNSYHFMIIISSYFADSAVLIFYGNLSGYTFMSQFLTIGNSNVNPNFNIDQLLVNSFVSYETSVILDGGDHV